MKIRKKIAERRAITVVSWKRFGLETTGCVPQAGSMYTGIWLDVHWNWLDEELPKMDDICQQRGGDILNLSTNTEKPSKNITF
jgi:hypothetical protein